MFATTLWFIWKWRCAIPFQENFSKPGRPRVHIAEYTKEWMTVYQSHYDVIPRATTNITWNAPEAPYFKLNTDAVKSSDGSCVVADVCRDTTGAWKWGSYHNTGVAQVLDAEIWAISKAPSCCPGAIHSCYC